MCKITKLIPKNICSIQKKRQSKWQKKNSSKKFNTSIYYYSTVKKKKKFYMFWFGDMEPNPTYVVKPYTMQVIYMFNHLCKGEMNVNRILVYS